MWLCIWIRCMLSFIWSFFSALAASRRYNQNLNLYTCNMLDFVTELCFVAVLMKTYIYIFEPFVLTLICKELALLACRLITVVLPPTHSHTHTQHVPARIPVCQTSKGKAAMITLTELISELGSLMGAVCQCQLVRNQNAPLQGRAFSKICNDSFYLDFICSSFCHFETMCDFILFFLVFHFDH